MGLRTNVSRLINMLVLLGIVGGLANAQTGGGTTSVKNSLCGIIGSIATVIGVFALIMFVLGGTLYAFAHFLPAAGNLKGSMQGWGMGMLMGGIIALILYILAPFIIGKIIGLSNTGGIGVNASTPNVQPASCAGALSGI